MCDYCKSAGHIKDKCYKLMGIPKTITTKIIDQEITMVARILDNKAQVTKEGEW